MSIVKRKVAVVTATRAEYGLLRPLMKRIETDDELDINLIVTGSHLSEKHGYTQNEIISDGFTITHRLEILDPENNAQGISKTMANAIEKFSDCFANDRPEILILLGDRTELLGAAIAAENEGIPIAHISGGEITQGAVDDCIRHALTKLSFLHFASTEIYRKRIIQLGEEPNRVFNVGALSVENIRKHPLMSEKEIRDFFGFSAEIPYALVTFHPVTLENDIQKQHDIQELCEAMDIFSICNFVITGSNADNGGDKYNVYLKKFAKKHPDRIKMYMSLGMTRYLSALKYASFMLGNSSSGTTEAPILGTPVVNIGDRQKGRLMPETIINCKVDKDEIIASMNKAMLMKHKSVKMFGEGDSSEKIVEIIKSFLKSGMNLKKKFYDIEFDY